MNLGCRPGYIPDAIHLRLDKLENLMTDQLKLWITDIIDEICLGASEVAGEANHLFADYINRSTRQEPRIPAPTLIKFRVVVMKKF